MSARLNGHDRLKSEAGSSQPGSDERIADLRDWYHLDRLLGGEPTSPFNEPKRVSDWCDIGSFDGSKPLASINAHNRQQRAEQE
jgi:hypothetical protein